jgi:hypothetical protein
METQFNLFHPHIYFILGWFTKEELEAADENGFVGMSAGIPCYITRHIPAVSARGTYGGSK